MHEFSVLAIAAFLDYLIGDPPFWIHPVQVMGWVITQYTNLVFTGVQSLRGQRIAGIGLAIGVIGGTGLLSWLIVGVIRSLPLPTWAGLGLEGLMLASCFAGRSLRAAADDVLRGLETGNVAIARSRLSRYVGRDTAELSEPDILRAVLETVTENATDGVMAPLFYAIVGSFLPTGAVPLALAYKAASTLDSMVGYRDAPYTHLGWFSARLEDGLTWIPCRLTVLTLSLLSGRPRRVWALCRRDAPQDPSPNAGWSECAYAAILQVQLGGMNVYRGVVKQKPLLGDPIHPITPATIHGALRLTRLSFLTWITLTFVAVAARIQFQ